MKKSASFPLSGPRGLGQRDRNVGVELRGRLLRLHQASPHTPRAVRTMSVAFARIVDVFDRAHHAVGLDEPDHAVRRKIIAPGPSRARVALPVRTRPARVQARSDGRRHRTSMQSSCCAPRRPPIARWPSCRQARCRARCRCASAAGLVVTRLVRGIAVHIVRVARDVATAAVAAHELVRLGVCSGELDVARGDLSARPAICLARNAL